MLSKTYCNHITWRQNPEWSSEIYFPLQVFWEKSSKGRGRRSAHLSNLYNQTATTNETIVSSLHPNTLYKFTVAAFNINGQGEESAPITLTMGASEGKCLFILFRCSQLVHVHHITFCL